MSKKLWLVLILLFPSTGWGGNPVLAVVDGKIRRVDAVVAPTVSLRGSDDPVLANELIEVVAEPTGLPDGAVEHYAFSAIGPDGNKKSMVPFGRECLFSAGDVPGKIAVHCIAVYTVRVGQDTFTYSAQADTAIEVFVATPVPPAPSGQLARVLMVYESTTNLTRAQYDVLVSEAVRARLSEVCPKDGQVPAWRCWDKDVDVSKETDGWKAAWAAVETRLTSLPALVIFDPVPRIMPLPGTVDDFLTILKPYSEAK